MVDPRTPWAVPDEPDACHTPGVRRGFDSDTDGVPDSAFARDGDDLLLHTDLGDDGHADRTLRLRPDGSTSAEDPPCVDDDPSFVELILRFLRGY